MKSRCRLDEAGNRRGGIGGYTGFHGVHGKLMKTRFVVKKMGPDYSLHKSYNGRPVTFILKNMKDGKFELYPATYVFVNSISHYDYVRVENRFCRNKQVIFKVLKELKKINFLNRISNISHYLKPNEGNKKKVKSFLLKDLDKLLV